MFRKLLEVRRNEQKRGVKFQVAICNRVCEYDKCDKCRKKILETEDFDEKPQTFKVKQSANTIMHLLYRSHDTDTNMDRRKYENIIRRSNNPLRKIMDL